MPILAILYTVGGRGYSHSIHKVTEVGPQSTKGVGTHDAKWWFCKQTRWDFGGGHMTLCTVTSWSFIQLGSSTQLCCIGSKQWGWGSSSYPKSSYTGPIYRNTLASLPPGKQIYIFFWKIKIRLSKTEFFKFCFFSKKSVKTTLNSLEVTKCWKS
jgi:hypothetical protein